MKFYTSAVLAGDGLLLREIEDGEKKAFRLEPEVSLYEACTGQGTHCTIYDEPVRELRFATVSEARARAEARGPRLYGMDRWVYQVLNERYPGKLDYDPAQVSVAFLDIECASDEGFPSITNAIKPITAITLEIGPTAYVFGCGRFLTEDPGVIYKECADEKELLDTFLHVWETDPPDIVSGWNIEFFDVPYLVNRIGNVLGPRRAERLSPWGKIRRRTVMNRGREEETWNLSGVAILDYMQLYKKFTYEPRESYSLNHIATVELDEKKLDYSSYESLLDLYKRDHQKFIEYNIHDVRLVSRLEKKMRLIELSMKIAYDAKINYEDVLASSRPWDAIIHNHLLERGRVVPMKRHVEVDENGTAIKDNLIGGYVKNPDAGSYDWVVSFDVKSEYPHVIMQWNISPDAYRGKLTNSLTIDDILEGRLAPYVEHLQKRGLCLSANMRLYAREPTGFLPELMEHFFQERQRYAEEEGRLEAEFERTMDAAIKSNISRYTNFQMATKIMLNSAFGCLSNPYFRWFGPEAESITMTGRLVIMWAERIVNGYLNTVLGTSEDYVVAMDTDSLYVRLGPLLRRAFGREPTRTEALDFIDKVCEEKLGPVIDQGFEELARITNCARNRISMKREVICDKAIWTGAKNYVLSVLDNKGLRYEESRIKVKGIKAVKPSTPARCRQKIEEALRLIVSGDEKTLQALVEDFRIEFNALPFEDIAFPRNISGLTRYRDDGPLYKSGTPIQVRAALVYNAMIARHGLTSFPPIYDGDKVKFCYLALPNPTSENVIAVPSVLPRQLGLEKYVDRGTQFQKAFLDPLHAILDAVGWKTRQSGSLEEFFA